MVRHRQQDWQDAELPPPVDLGRGRTSVRLELRPQGRDLVLLIGGGAVHVGAVAVAAAGGEPLTVVPLTGHKEGPLAADAARRLARAGRCVCTVVAGIHQDAATRAEIDAIVGHVAEGVARLACSLSTRSDPAADPAADPA